MYDVHARSTLLNHAGALHQPKLQGRISCIQTTHSGTHTRWHMDKKCYLLFIFIFLLMIKTMSYSKDQKQNREEEKKRQIINEVM